MIGSGPKSSCPGPGNPAYHLTKQPRSNQPPHRGSRIRAAPGCLFGEVTAGEIAVGDVLLVKSRS
jgi:hypothetical protein